MQIQIEKPTQNKQFKIGIVGPSKPKWKNSDQYERMKTKIEHIILMNGKLIKKEIVSDQVDLSNLTIVSGHCPVGEERYFCATCNSWSTLPYGVSLHVGHKLIKVYDQGGVDTETEIIATKLGAKTEIYPAPAMRWEDKVLFENEFHKAIAKGYHSRNIQIAEVCDGLYCIVPESYVDTGPSAESDYCRHCKMYGHPTNGGCYTLQYAKKLGKETHLVVIK